MKIYSDADLNYLVIEGVSQGPVSDFVVTNTVDTISIFRKSGQYFDLYEAPYSTIQNGSGATFNSVTEAKAYIQGLLVPYFPLRFTAAVPLSLDETTRVLDIDELYITDGGNF